MNLKTIQLCKYSKKSKTFHFPVFEHSIRNSRISHAPRPFSHAVASVQREIFTEIDARIENSQDFHSVRESKCPKLARNFLMKLKDVHLIGKKKLVRNFVFSDRSKHFDSVHLWMCRTFPIINQNLFYAILDRDFKSLPSWSWIWPRVHICNKLIAVISRLWRLIAVWTCSVDHRVGCSCIMDHTTSNYSRKLKRKSADVMIWKSNGAEERGKFCGKVFHFSHLAPLVWY